MKMKSNRVWHLLGIAFFAAWPLLGNISCGETVNCENLCTRTLKCNVSFQPADDPDRAKVVVGERTEQDSCVAGCMDNEVVTVQGARCIDEVPIKNGEACQNDMLQCLGALVDDGAAQ